MLRNSKKGGPSLNWGQVMKLASEALTDISHEFATAASTGTDEFVTHIVVLLLDCD